MPDHKISEIELWLTDYSVYRYSHFMESSQIIKGVLPTLVLAVLNSEDTYGYALLKTLRDSGLSEIGDASVYGTLQKLASAGLITSYLKESDAGPARRYYSITTAGRKNLKSQTALWNSFSHSVNSIIDRKS